MAAHCEERTNRQRSVNHLQTNMDSHESMKSDIVRTCNGVIPSSSLWLAVNFFSSNILCMTETSPIRAICMISSPRGIELLTPSRPGFTLFISTLVSCCVTFGGLVVPFPLGPVGDEFEAMAAVLFSLLCGCIKDAPKAISAREPYRRVSTKRDTRVLVHVRR